MRRTLTVVAVAVIVAGGLAFAQDRALSRADRAKRVAAALKTSLTAAQRAKPVDQAWVKRLQVALDDVDVLAAPPQLSDLTEEQLQALRSELKELEQPADEPTWTDNDWDGALERAQRAGRPVLFDVTGVGCVNCLELRRSVGEMPRAQRMLSKRFELARIWIVDPKISPLDEQQRKRVKKEFGTNSIPLHVIVDPRDGSELARLDWTPYMTPEDYLEFLQSGLRAYTGK